MNIIALISLKESREDKAHALTVRGSRAGFELRLADSKSPTQYSWIDLQGVDSYLKLLCLKF